MKKIREAYSQSNAEELNGIILANAEELSQQSDESILHYYDVDLSSADEEKFLQSDTVESVISVEKENTSFVKGLKDADETLESDDNYGIRGRFRRFRAFVKKWFCKAVAFVTTAGKNKWKDVIAKVCQYILDALKVTSLNPIVMRIIEALIAFAIKKGVAKVCPA